VIYRFRGGGEKDYVWGSVQGKEQEVRGRVGWRDAEKVSTDGKGWLCFNQEQREEKERKRETVKL
jgi:hypothetical protein